jgi:hypothetical protein
MKFNQQRTIQTYKVFKNLIIGFVLLALLFGGAVSCSKKSSKTKEQVMQELLTEKFHRWKTDKERKCREQVMEKASAIVDSTIIENARQNKDAEGGVALPVRPMKPEIKLPVDSTPVEPLITPPDSLQ